jgi:hypothetical protein
MSDGAEELPIRAYRVTPPTRNLFERCFAGEAKTICDSNLLLYAARSRTIVQEFQGTSRILGSRGFSNVWRRPLLLLRTPVNARSLGCFDGLRMLRFLLAVFGRCTIESMLS